MEKQRVLEIRKQMIDVESEYLNRKNQILEERVKLEHVRHNLTEIIRETKEKVKKVEMQIMDNRSRLQEEKAHFNKLYNELRKTLADEGLWINKGDVFVCKKIVIDHDNVVRYYPEKIYMSPQDRVITTEQGESREWGSSWIEFFERAELPF